VEVVEALKCRLRLDMKLNLRSSGLALVPRHENPAGDRADRHHFRGGVPLDSAVSTIGICCVVGFIVLGFLIVRLSGWDG
jgi:hypothetical protein